jgi:arylformamidase
MRTYDISMTISPDMPVWPGDPNVVIQRIGKIDEGAEANVSKLNMCVHTGTHVDAPFHFLQEGNTVEQLSLKLLTGRVYVLHLPEVDVITRDVLEGSGIPPRTRRVLFRTRNSDLWKAEVIDFQSGYVGVSSDGAEYLVNRGVKLVGVDYLSVAPYESTKATHQILLEAGIVIVEGLDLSKVSQGRYTLYCLPLKIVGCDGAPARAILVGV